MSNGIPVRFNREDIPLNVAVFLLRKKMSAAGQKVGAEKWTLYDEFRSLLREQVIELDQSLSGVTTDNVCRVFLQQRKNKKRQMAVELGISRGWKCFYEGRNGTLCDDLLTVERLVPGVRGGTYDSANTIISCHRHNTQRNSQSLEEYLSKI